jgi:curved DNA-binding protein CbpA
LSGLAARGGAGRTSTVNRNRANSGGILYRRFPVGEDLYRVLQVDPSAGHDVIAAAYKRLALRYHPDHNGGDPSAEQHMRRINEAYRILGKPDLRADYDARSGAGLPELEIVPSSVVLRSFDPSAREINFSVRLTQTAGPTFDRSRHLIDLALHSPWHQADVHWHWSRETLPADIEFTLAFGDSFLRPGSTLSGDIELSVSAKDRS